jgi:hypothetical protein
MDQEAHNRDQRSTLLTVVFMVIGGAFFLFFLFLACGGLWLYVVAVVTGTTLIGCFHYLLWGYALSAEINAETNEEPSDLVENPIPDRQEAQEWTPEERSWYRRF